MRFTNPLPPKKRDVDRLPGIDTSFMAKAAEAIWMGTVEGVNQIWVPLP